MKLNRVLIAYKGDIRSSLTSSLTQRRRQHRQVARQVLKIVRRVGLMAKMIDRRKLRRNFKADLLITIGGDCTVFDAAHVAGSTPILGVNSIPKTSIGFFCAANAKNFSDLLNQIRSGLLKPIALPLLEISINGKKIPERALNDILFAADSPAETSRYILKFGKISEWQRSSGVWIAAGPGSTAAIHSAGGKPLPLKSTRLQYVVREPYALRSRRYRFTFGILKKGALLRLLSDMPAGKIYIDGPKCHYLLPPGATITVKISSKKLKIFL